MKNMKNMNNMEKIKNYSQGEWEDNSHLINNGSWRTTVLDFNEIYLFDLYIHIVTNVTEVLVAIDGEQKDLPTLGNMSGCYVRDNEGYMHVILIDLPSIDVVVHEFIHFLNDFATSIGVFCEKDHDEPYAYLMSGLIRKYENVIESYKEKYHDKNSNIDLNELWDSDEFGDKVIIGDADNGKVVNDILIQDVSRRVREVTSDDYDYITTSTGEDCEKVVDQKYSEEANTDSIQRTGEDMHLILSFINYLNSKRNGVDSYVNISPTEIHDFFNN